MATLVQVPGPVLHFSQSRLRVAETLGNREERRERHQIGGAVQRPTMVSTRSRRFPGPVATGIRLETISMIGRVKREELNAR